jgi:carbon monoxide dehydrogenase subunit G
MEMNGSRIVPTDVATTWKALNDPDVLKACIPGCETIESTASNEYKVTMTARVGPVSARFSGRIVLSDIVPPTSYTLSFDGQGGAAGFAKGEARVGLVAVDGGTRVDYAAKAQVGGKLAQIGSRLVDGAAAKVADDFFARFGERVSAPVTVAAPLSPPLSPPPLQASPTSSNASLIRWISLAAIVVAVAIYAWLRRS